MSIPSSAIRVTRRNDPDAAEPWIFEAFDIEGRIVHSWTRTHRCDGLVANIQSDINHNLADRLEELSQHTPLPWDLVESTEHHGPYITTNYGTTVCDFYAMSDPSAPSTRNGGTSKPIHFTDADENARFVYELVRHLPVILAALRREP